MFIHTYLSNLNPGLLLRSFVSFHAVPNAPFSAFQQLTFAAMKPSVAQFYYVQSPKIP